MRSVSTQHEHRPSEDEDYQALLAHLHSASIVGPLFATDANEMAAQSLGEGRALFDGFLAGLPLSRRQHYTCRACRKFVERFGGLVTVDDRGLTASPFWRAVRAPAFGFSVTAMANLVAKARITGVFLSEEPVWGIASNTAKNGPHKGVTWNHMHAVPQSVHRPSALKSTFSAMAEKHEDFGMLSRGLAEFPRDVVQQAHTLLTTGGLYRSEKCIEIAKWLLDLHEIHGVTKNQRARENLVWRAVALAPPGYAHVRSTMIATLLEDIVAGKPFEDIKRSFDAKMSPIQYQRPQAVPTDGQLAAAEAVVAKLASAGSLARRYATLDDVKAHAVWLPKASNAPKDGSVFGHLKSAKANGAIDVPVLTVTWEKFARTVLDEAERVEYAVPFGAASFFAFVTATDANAPPILQWDREDARNPVSWYLYHGGSPASQWSLAAGTHVDVTAVTMQPSGWSGKSEHQGDGAYFILSRCVDSGAQRAGLGLFPEILRAEYREIRSAIEAFSRRGELSGRESASACGVCVQKSGGVANVTLRVTVKGVRASYRIDRWD